MFFASFSSVIILLNWYLLHSGVGFIPLLLHSVMCLYSNFSISLFGVVVYRSSIVRCDLKKLYRCCCLSVVK